MPRHKKITDSFTIENFLFVLSEFSKLFLIRLNIQTHSVVMTTNTSKNHRCDINSQANVLYLSYKDSQGQLSAFPLTYCSIINCGNVSSGMADIIYHACENIRVSQIADYFGYNEKYLHAERVDEVIKKGQP